MHQKVKVTDQFVARTNTGRRVAVVEYTTYLESAGTQGTIWVEGLKSYKTRTGDPLNATGFDQYAMMDGTPLIRI
jgi:hypothetical protein